MIPDALRQQLQLLMEHQPMLKQIISYLPGDLQRVAGTPEGLLALLLTAAVGLLVLLALAGSSKSKKGSSILIAGPMNAGKSTLYYQLADSSQHNGLVASMEQNTGVASVNGKQARLLDIPGHHSFRHKLESSLKEAAGIVFVLDAAEITPHRVEAAEMLYELLTNAALSRQRTPLLLACNKADLEDEAHSTEFIRKTLERQLDAMRKTKTAGIGKEASGGVALGAADKPFSFQGLRSKVCLRSAAQRWGSWMASRPSLRAACDAAAACRTDGCAASKLPTRGMPAHGAQAVDAAQPATGLVASDSGFALDWVMLIVCQPPQLVANVEGSAKAGRAAGGKCRGLCKGRQGSWMGWNPSLLAAYDVPVAIVPVLHAVPLVLLAVCVFAGLLMTLHACTAAALVAF
ncbi:signal recognition particle receptor beta subunit-domain-containing protein [Scenedesmus sp. NREL 46B-D3]|nr:signal recognition particle receptor beta subunit-domain-containing protein [Scenedesmus sp. NREL 46B-D3]